MSTPSEDFGDDYGSFVVPADLYPLFDRSVEASPAWPYFDDNLKVQMTDTFVDYATFGNMDGLQLWLDEMEIEWDDDDWEEWRNFYEG